MIGAGPLVTFTCNEAREGYGNFSCLCACHQLERGRSLVLTHKVNERAIRQPERGALASLQAEAERRGTFIIRLESVRL